MLTLGGRGSADGHGGVGRIKIKIKICVTLSCDTENVLRFCFDFVFLRRFFFFHSSCRVTWKFECWKLVKGKLFGSFKCNEKNHSFMFYIKKNVCVL